ncbi:hypothetical protein [Alteromonas ponticola]|uniref:Phytanoyl-CoA dioxygenase n=1 Tax=Alteromonas ponticola TaxID=2720613 RepID=A0ABX1R0B2_9ALTE|nr:hypothetical protein [Alteromonas ponticola]NMH58507.1 hypothetical protein [Alteromonas ponticola]
MSEFNHAKTMVITEFLAYLRLLSRRLKMSQLITISRQLVHFGPWRNIALRLLPRSLPPAGVQGAVSLLPKHNSSEVVSSLRQDGLFILGELPHNFISKLRLTTDKLPLKEYKLVHQVSDEIRQLSRDPNLLSLLHDYFNRTPQLIEASLFVTGPESHLPDHSQNSFHFDYAGWESLNVFVYLTDVTLESSYHVYVKGSAKQISWWDVLRQIVPKTEVYSRFNADVTPILGKAGTIFIENAEGFHRRNKGAERRVLLNLLYTSHRNVLSYGRSNRKGLRARDRIFKEITSQQSNTL